MFYNSHTRSIDYRFSVFYNNEPKLKLVSNNTENSNACNDRSHFEWLYDKYAPKAFGFITKYAATKEQAEEFLIIVFLKVWENIKFFEIDADKKIQQIVLLTCKPIYKAHV